MNRSLAFLLFSVLSSSATAVDLYDFTDLGSIQSASLQELQSLKLDINDAGSVVGWSRGEFNYTPVKAFVWQPGIGRVALNSNTQVSDAAMGINDSGLIVGWSNAGGQKAAVVWQQVASEWQMTTLPLQEVSEAVDVDASGNIVGTSVSGSFLWNFSANQFHAMNSAMTGIQPASISGGQVVGSRNIGFNHTEGVLLRAINDSVLTGSLQNSVRVYSSADAVNSAGQMVGGAETDDLPCTRVCFPAMHAFIWDETNGIRDLLVGDARTSWANDINDDGLIVGWRLALPSSIAVLWQNNVALDLNVLTVNPNGWQLERAHRVNSSGQIVGLATKGGVTSAFLLTPNGTTANSADISLAALTLPQSKLASRQSDTTAVYAITNHGPDVAETVSIRAPLPEGLMISDAQLGRGSCVIDVELACEVNNVAVDETIILSLQLASQRDGAYAINLMATGSELDGGVFANNAVSSTFNLLTMAEEPVVGASDENAMVEAQVQPEEQVSPPKARAAASALNPGVIVLCLASLLWRRLSVRHSRLFII